MDFTDDEIREELARLGYKDVPEEKLSDFKNDLLKLINTERSKNSSLNSSRDGSKPEVKGYPPAPEFESESAAGNFSNYGSQWLRSKYREDWHYEGEKNQLILNERYITSKPTLRSPPAPLDISLDVAAEKKSYAFDKQNNCANSNYSDSEADSTTKYIKRKTIRKGTNGRRVIDESFSTTDSIDSSDLCDIYEKIKRLAMRDCECGKSRPTSTESAPPYRIQGINRNPSVLVTHKEPPHTRNLVRVKPFQRHQMYQRAWKLQPPVGTDFHHTVCREVHNKLLKKEEVKMSHKVFVPNPYVVPSEKPRYELRWAVRKCNQNYELPKCGFFHEV